MGRSQVRIERVYAPVCLSSVTERLRFGQESFGALHQMLVGLSEPEQDDAWAEIEEALSVFEREDGYEGPCEMLVAAVMNEIDKAGA